MRTICHAHAQVVDALPVTECLDYRTLATIDLDMIIVVIHEVVPDEELVLALFEEQESEAEVMEQAPYKRMYKVDHQGIGVRQFRQERKTDTVSHDQDEHGVRGPSGRALQVSFRSICPRPYQY